MTEPGKQGLTAAQAELLPADLRHALEHPLRRQILRTLHADGGELTPAELGGCGCLPCTLPCVSYHLGVLVEAGLARRLPGRSVRGTLEHRFVSTADDKQAVVEILQATAAADGLRLELART